MRYSNGEKTRHWNCAPPDELPEQRELRIELHGGRDRSSASFLSRRSMDMRVEPRARNNVTRPDPIAAGEADSGPGLTLLLAVTRQPLGILELESAHGLSVFCNFRPAWAFVREL
jgi:hypothetical protein